MAIGSVESGGCSSNHPNALSGNFNNMMWIGIPVMILIFGPALVIFLYYFYDTYKKDRKEDTDSLAREAKQKGSFDFERWKGWVFMIIEFVQLSSLSFVGDYNFTNAESSPMKMPFFEEVLIVIDIVSLKFTSWVPLLLFIVFFVLVMLFILWTQFLHKPLPSLFVGIVYDALYLMIMKSFMEVFGCTYTCKYFGQPGDFEPYAPLDIYPNIVKCWSYNQVIHILWAVLSGVALILYHLFSMKFVAYGKNLDDPAMRLLPFFNVTFVGTKLVLTFVQCVINIPNFILPANTAVLFFLFCFHYYTQPCLGFGFNVNNARSAFFFAEFAMSACAMLAQFYEEWTELLVIFAPCIAATGGVAAFFLNQERARNKTMPKFDLIKLLDGFELEIRLKSCWCIVEKLDTVDEELMRHAFYTLQDIIHSEKVSVDHRKEALDTIRKGVYRDIGALSMVNGGSMLSLVEESCGSQGRLAAAEHTAEVVDIIATCADFDSLSVKDTTIRTTEILRVLRALAGYVTGLDSANANADAIAYTDVEGAAGVSRDVKDILFCRVLLGFLANAMQNGTVAKRVCQEEDSNYLFFVNVLGRYHDPEVNTTVLHTNLLLTLTDISIDPDVKINTEAWQGGVVAQVLQSLVHPNDVIVGHAWYTLLYLILKVSPNYGSGHDQGGVVKVGTSVKATFDELFRQALTDAGENEIVPFTPYNVPIENEVKRKDETKKALEQLQMKLYRYVMMVSTEIHKKQGGQGHWVYLSSKAGAEGALGDDSANVIPTRHHLGGSSRSGGRLPGVGPSGSETGLLFRGGKGPKGGAGDVEDVEEELDGEGEQDLVDFDGRGREGEEDLVDIDGRGEEGGVFISDNNSEEEEDKVGSSMGASLSNGTNSGGDGGIGIGLGGGKLANSNPQINANINKAMNNYMMGAVANYGYGRGSNETSILFGGVLRLKPDDEEDMGGGSEYNMLDGTMGMEMGMWGAGVTRSGFGSGLDGEEKGAGKGEDKGKANLNDVDYVDGEFEDAEWNLTNLITGKRVIKWGITISREQELNLDEKNYQENKRKLNILCKPLRNTPILGVEAPRRSMLLKSNDESRTMGDILGRTLKRKRGHDREDLAIFSDKLMNDHPNTYDVSHKKLSIFSWRTEAERREKAKEREEARKREEEDLKEAEADSAVTESFLLPQHARPLHPAYTCTHTLSSYCNRSAYPINMTSLPISCYQWYDDLVLVNIDRTAQRTQAMGTFRVGTDLYAPCCNNVNMGGTLQVYREVDVLTPMYAEVKARERYELEQLNLIRNPPSRPSSGGEDEVETSQLKMNDSQKNRDKESQQERERVEKRSDKNEPEFMSYEELTELRRKYMKQKMETDSKIIKEAAECLLMEQRKDAVMIASPVKVMVAVLLKGIEDYKGNAAHANKVTCLRALLLRLLHVERVALYVLNNGLNDKDKDVLNFLSGYFDDKVMLAEAYGILMRTLERLFAREQYAVEKWQRKKPRKGEKVKYNVVMLANEQAYSKLVSDVKMVETAAFGRVQSVAAACIYTTELLKVFLGLVAAKDKKYPLPASTLGASSLFLHTRIPLFLPIKGDIKSTKVRDSHILVVKMLEELMRNVYTELLKEVDLMLIPNPISLESAAAQREALFHSKVNESGESAGYRESAGVHLVVHSHMNLQLENWFNTGAHAKSIQHVVNLLLLLTALAHASHEAALFICLFGYRGHREDEEESKGKKDKEKEKDREKEKDKDPEMEMVEREKEKSFGSTLLTLDADNSDFHLRVTTTAQKATELETFPWLTTYPGEEDLDYIPRDPKPLKDHKDHKDRDIFKKMYPSTLTGGTSIHQLGEECRKLLDSAQDYAVNFNQIKQTDAKVRRSNRYINDIRLPMVEQHKRCTNRCSQDEEVRYQDEKRLTENLLRLHGGQQKDSLKVNHFLRLAGTKKYKEKLIGLYDLPPIPLLACVVPSSSSSSSSDNEDFHVPENRPQILSLVACLLVSNIELVRKTALGFIHALLDRADCGSFKSSGPQMRTGCDYHEELSKYGYSSLGGFSRISSPLVIAAAGRNEDDVKNAADQDAQNAEKERKAGEAVLPFILRLLAEGLVPYALRYVLLLYGVKRKSNKGVESNRKLQEIKEELNKLKKKKENSDKNLKKMEEERSHFHKFKFDHRRYQELKKEVKSLADQVEECKKEESEQKKLNAYEKGVGLIEVDREMFALTLDILYMMCRGCLSSSNNAVVRKHLFVDVVGIVYPTPVMIHTVALYSTGSNVGLLCILVCAADQATLQDVSRTIVPYVLVAAVHSPLRRMVVQALVKIAEVMRFQKTTSLYKSLKKELGRLRKADRGLWGDIDKIENLMR